ncbi:hypothetical protein [uncultured Phycicoccus sp.]|uniref:hypothetical protein n=1 Tax=uncultured Phycicoccus sp. TaxID=661422 RepID=UPI00260188A8|nr:hypothetical protein [uncultured Phycicoccus sp.]
MPARRSATIATTGWSRVHFGLRVIAVATVACAAILAATVASGTIPGHTRAPVLTWAGVSGT